MNCQRTQKIKKIPETSLPIETKIIPNEVTENIPIEDIEVECFLFSFKFYKKNYAN